jgi:tetratricopeptide (TPR) repeat protein
MAETITLRAYLDEVNNLLARGAATEVISHCRYILQHYPRNIETYRLLAQALLQKAQDQGIEPLFAEAAEVFQRVLGVMPNDYVAHLGLSEIREHENQLDQAIWHMERAYEQIPGNQLLQAALRGLYGKRDGENRAPEKIHLTRGALARQYVTGQLYDQALIELRHALEQDPSRLDLQVMLAETLWESHHPVEAGEMAVQILKRLPDCLPANRILARLWLDNERPSDAQYFLDQVEALDPYAAADVLQPDARVPDPNLLTRLDYSTEAQATLSQETPDWIQDLGDLNEADVSSVFQMPLTSPAPGPGAPAASEQAGGIDWFGEQGETPADGGDVPDWFAAAEQAAPGSAAPVETDLPDWFSELGGQPQQSAAPTSQEAVEASWLSGLDTPEDIFGASAAEVDGGAPADADWLADFGSLDEQPMFGSEPEVSEGAPPTEAASDLEWLLEAETPSEVPAADGQPAEAEAEFEEDWLTGFGEVGISSFEVVDQETPSEPASSESQTGTEIAEEADWWAASPESADTLTDEAGDDTVEAGANMRPSSGFTELLAGIEPAEISSEETDTDGDAGILPPEWLAASADDLSEADQEEAIRRLLEDQEPTAQPEEASQEEDAWAWEEAVESEDEHAGDLGAFSQPVDEQAEAEVSDELEPGDIPDWLTEPESDFFALASERVQEEIQTAPPADDWFSELEDAGEVTDISEPVEMASELSEDALRAAAGGDQEDWFDEELEEELPADDQWTLEEPELSEEQIEEEALAGELPDWFQEAAPDEQAVAAAEPAGEDVIAADEAPAPFAVEEAEEEEDTLVVEDWLKPEAGALFEADETASEAELDWLQPQPAQGDWLGAFARSDAAEGERTEDDLFLTFEEPEEPEISPVDDMARQSDEWLAAAPEAEIEETVADEPEAVAFDMEEGTLFGDEETFAEVDEAPAVSEPEAAPAAEPGEDLIETGLAETDEASFEAGEIPAWMFDLEPVELEETPKEEGLLDRPYDPFEGGSAENVPEYRSARETGILQPDESPDWMAAFGDEDVPIELETDEAAESETGLDEDESLLVALGIEADEEPDTDLETEAEEASTESEEAEDVEAAPPVEEELAPLADEEGAMPDWLAAITTSATEQFEDLRFEAADTYSSSAEASGVVSESDLDWLAPLGEETDVFQEPVDNEASDEIVDKPLDMDAIFAGVESLGEEDEESAVDEAEFPGLGLGDLELADDSRSEVEAIDSWFADIPVKSGDEAETSEAKEEELFDFDLPETQVAQPDDLAHTREIEEDEEGDMPWLEDASIPDDFSFEELTPRWLRRPKESDQQASSHEHDAAPGAPDWLRNVFEDDEFDEQ